MKVIKQSCKCDIVRLMIKRKMLYVDNDSICFDRKWKDGSVDSIILNICQECAKPLTVQEEEFSEIKDRILKSNEAKIEKFEQGLIVNKIIEKPKADNEKWPDLPEDLNYWSSRGASVQDLKLAKAINKIGRKVFEEKNHDTH